MTAAYACSSGHQIWAPEDRVICRCPVCVDGEPCSGTIARVGEGSTAARSCSGSGSPAVPLRSGSTRGRCPECGKSVALTRESRIWTHEPKEVEPMS